MKIPLSFILLIFLMLFSTVNTTKETSSVHVAPGNTLSKPIKMSYTDISSATRLLSFTYLVIITLLIFFVAIGSGFTQAPSDPMLTTLNHFANCPINFQHCPISPTVQSYMNAYGFSAYSQNGFREVLCPVEFNDEEKQRLQRKACLTGSPTVGCFAISCFISPVLRRGAFAYLDSTGKQVASLEKW
jgi:hypothetical protein